MGGDPGAPRMTSMMPTTLANGRPVNWADSEKLLAAVAFRLGPEAACSAPCISGNRPRNPGPHSA